jgi:hypothetical protein
LPHRLHHAGDAAPHPRERASLGHVFRPIEGIGPRYCPSIEDKIVKFPDKTQHQFFLEPEGLNTHEVYVNGMSTSLPMEVQWQIVHSIPGLDQAEMLRPGYAIEYDSVDATELDRTLRVKAWTAFILPGRSTEQVDMKKPPARASWPASTPRSGSRASRPSPWTGPKATRASSSTI